MPPSGQYIGQVREHMAADSLRGLAHEVAQENLQSSWKVDLRFANPLLKLCQRTDSRLLCVRPLLNDDRRALLLGRRDISLDPKERHAIH